MRLSPQFNRDSRIESTPMNTTAPRPVVGIPASRRSAAATGGDMATT
jgi:hypothetical protein